MQIKVIFGGLAIIAALFASSGAIAGPRSGCLNDQFKITHWMQPVEAFFDGPKTGLTIEGLAGNYNKGFTDYLEKDPTWGLADNGKYIGKLLVPGQGKVWKISNSGAPIAAPDGSGVSAELGRLFRNYAMRGYGVIATHDNSRLPIHQWVTIPGYSGDKKYIVLDWAAESNNNLIVILEPGFYRGIDVSYSSVCYTSP